MTGINKGGRSSGVAGKSILNRAHRTPSRLPAAPDVTYVLGHILEDLARSSPGVLTAVFLAKRRAGLK